MKNCAIGGCDEKHPKVCPTCVHWTPSQSSKYYYCRRYLESRITCDLPRSSCATCPLHEPTGEMGRPNLSGRDWDSARDYSDYMRKYMKERRAKKK